MASGLVQVCQVLGVIDAGGPFSRRGGDRRGTRLGAGHAKPFQRVIQVQHFDPPFAIRGWDARHRDPQHDPIAGDDIHGRPALLLVHINRCGFQIADSVPRKMLDCIGRCPLEGYLHFQLIYNESGRHRSACSTTIMEVSQKDHALRSLAGEPASVLITCWTQPRVSNL